jgi:hypothetical protein
LLNLRPLRGGLRWGARSVGRSGSHREHLSARCVSAPSDVREAVSSPDPELVELVPDPNALSVPPEITVEQAGSFVLLVAR